ncbi:hypothetical protein [Kocuria sp.]|uniref:hypothetical protein n=1 Tax=Kocuria sp. TaxID=1871328 RepID=UPI0026DB53D0|nr:hypothetical protein [Kocuria sp.]MDO4918297.1 hypothetical protein [Kocuria sp.]
MDIRPVTRRSVAWALLLLAAYCAAVMGYIWWISATLVRTLLWSLTAMLLLAIAAELRAFHPRIHHDAHTKITTYGARSQGSTTVDRSVREAARLLETACQRTAELDLTQRSPAGGKISTGPSFGSWGQRIRFAIAPGPHGGATITATCRPVFVLAVTDWGRADRTMREFFGEIQRVAAETAVDDPASPR